jgi:hypothetical protein
MVQTMSRLCRRNETDAAERAMNLFHFIHHLTMIRNLVHDALPICRATVVFSVNIWESS